jgi:hypothetical protein
VWPGSPPRGRTVSEDSASTPTTTRRRSSCPDSSPSSTGMPYSCCTRTHRPSRAPLTHPRMCLRRPGTGVRPVRPPPLVVRGSAPLLWPQSVYSTGQSSSPLSRRASARRPTTASPPTALSNVPQCKRDRPEDYGSLRTAPAIFPAIAGTLSRQVSKPARSGRMPLYSATCSNVTPCSTGISVCL